MLSLSLLISLSSFSQTGSIKGYIKTSDGKPAASVNIRLKETKSGTSSTEDGSYQLRNIAPGKYTIIASFVGLIPVEKPLEVSANETLSFDLTLAESASQLSEVVVTGLRSLNERTSSVGKAPIKAMDMPQSMVVINHDILERQQTLRLSEALMNISGVYIMGTTGGGQEEIAGRGYAFNSSNTFKNGVRYNNGAIPEISALEKLEVIKGSAAVLYGNVAAGGILNLVTKKPRFENGGELSLRAASYGFYKPSFDIYGPINKNIAYRVNTTYEKANSFRDNVHSQRYYINPSLLVKIGKQTELLLEGDYLDDKRTSDFGVGAINYSLINIPRSRFLGASWSYYNTEQKTATATITHRFNKNWELRSTTGYQSFNSDLSGTTRPNGSSQFIQPDGRWVRGLQRSGSHENYLITQFDLTGCVQTGKWKHILLLGADADNYHTDALAYAYSNAALGNKNIYDTINVFDLGKYKQRNDIPDITATTITHTVQRRAGLYAQDLISITEQLKLLAGIRYTYQESINGYVDSLVKNSRTNTIGTADKAFSPRAGLVYQPVKTISLFASYSNSFTLNTGTDIYLNPLKPSFINQYEAGIKTELFKRNVSANITVYRIVNSNLAQMAITDASGNANNNSNIKELAGEVTSKGVEIDIMSKPIQGFQFIGGYSYNQTKYTKSNTFVVGSKLRYNPEHTANASVHYTFDEAGILKGWSAGFVAYYIGKRVAGRSTTVASPTFALMPIPDYVQLDASVAYTVQKLTLRLKCSNLLNRLSYYVHDDNSVNPIAPRQVAASISLKL